ncbi:unnamed protein product [Heterosigma akashiwo]
MGPKLTLLRFLYSACESGQGSFQDIMVKEPFWSALQSCCRENEEETYVNDRWHANHNESSTCHSEDNNSKPSVGQNGHSVSAIARKICDKLSSI